MLTQVKIKLQWLVIIKPHIRTENNTRNKGHYIIIKGSVYQKDVSILNIKQKLTELLGEISSQ